MGSVLPVYNEYLKNASVRSLWEISTCTEQFYIKLFCRVEDYEYSSPKQNTNCYNAKSNQHEKVRKKLTMLNESKRHPLLVIFTVWYFKKNTHHTKAETASSSAGLKWGILCSQMQKKPGAARNQSWFKSSFKSLKLSLGAKMAQVADKCCNLAV